MQLVYESHTGGGYRLNGKITKFLQSQISKVKPEIHQVYCQFSESEWKEFDIRYSMEVKEM